MSGRILIVDVYASHRRVLVGFIHHIRPGMEVHQFDPSIAGRPHATFDWTGYELIIMDSNLGKESGLEWYKYYSASFKNFPPVMFLSSQNSVDIAVQAMKLGADEFLLKKGILQNRLKDAITALLPAPPVEEQAEHIAATQVLAGSAKAKIRAAAASGYGRRSRWR